MSTNKLARAAYAAYGATTQNRNFRGEPMPAWEDLPELIQRAWHNAAATVAMSAVVALKPPAHPVYPETAANECRHCGFLWPPGMTGERCPGCQQAYMS